MPEQKPICPRCGYDLTGAIDTWKTECPLEGICPECGLEFEWSRILRADILVHPWLVEHRSPRASPILDVTRRFGRTFASLLIPGRFWCDVSLEHRIRWQRLIAFVLASVCLLWFVRTIPNAANVALEHRLVPQWGTAYGTQYQWGQQHPQSMAAAVGRNRRSILDGSFDYEIVGAGANWIYDAWYLPSRPVALLIAVLLGPAIGLIFVCLPTSLRQSKVRPAHVLRIVMYASVAACFWGLVALLLYNIFWMSQTLTWLKTVSYNGYTSPSYDSNHFTTQFAWWMEEHVAESYWVSLVIAGLNIIGWRYAIARYLRMNHSLPIVILSAVMFYLASWIVAISIDHL